MQIFMWVLNSVLIVILLALFGNWLYLKIQAKRMGGALTNEEFEANMRKAQIIDVREKADFKKSHILGARNVPFSMIRSTYSEIRADLPVYIYGDSVGLSVRAVKLLRKNGYTNVSFLQNGFSKWEGKTKSSKY
ncbi:MULTISPECIES: rhodanese-like domain-containing protein [Amylolactobacillus]|nr:MULTISPECIES: rhodanese-like domain-containing protein [Amylolactobacillus]GED79891.1 sulfurtransferase [Amylolactobacillus amylophilus]